MPRVYCGVHHQAKNTFEKLIFVSISDHQGEWLRLQSLLWRLSNRTNIANIEKNPDTCCQVMSSCHQVYRKPNNIRIKSLLTSIGGLNGMHARYSLTASSKEDKKAQEISLKGSAGISDRHIPVIQCGREPSLHILRFLSTSMFPLELFPSKWEVACCESNITICVKYSKKIVLVHLLNLWDTKKINIFTSLDRCLKRTQDFHIVASLVFLVFFVYNLCCNGSGFFLVGCVLSEIMNSANFNEHISFRTFLKL